MKRIMGIDLGAARTGVALSDPLKITAQGLTAILSKSLVETARQVAALAVTHDVEEIVVGYPKNMDNSVGTWADETEKFAELLRRRVSVPVTLWDERLTTAMAHRALNETNTRGKKRKDVTDIVAAMLILQSYMEYRNVGKTE